MEPPKGVLASLWNFICFLPFFSGLLLLGIIKGQFQFVPCFGAFYGFFLLLVYSLSSLKLIV
jgi:hypothetical protein